MKKNLFMIIILIILMACVSFADDMMQKIIVTPDVPPASFDIQISINKGNGANYMPGENMSLTFRTNKDAYVVLYDIQPNGAVSIIFPNRYDQDNYVRGNTTYYLPRQGYNFTIDNIPGTEYIQAVASTRQFVNFIQWQQAFNTSVYPPVSMDAKNYFSNFSSKIAVVPNPQIEWTSAIVSFNVQPYPYNGYLNCTSYPSGAEVWVDGRFTGRRTPTNLTLSAGNHLVRYVITQHREKSQYVNIQPGVTSNLFMDILN
jgi:hypothetical protein